MIKVVAQVSYWRAVIYIRPATERIVKSVIGQGEFGFRLDLCYDSIVMAGFYDLSCCYWYRFEVEEYEKDGVLFIIYRLNSL